MSPLRRLARDMAKNTSYRRTRTTVLFDSLFEKYWRKKHPMNISVKKKPTIKGHRPVFKEIRTGGNS